MLQYEQCSCRLRIRERNRAGEIFLHQGRLVHAAYGSHTPRQAALEILVWDPIDVVLDPLPDLPAPSLQESLDYLLLEAARLQDERPSTPLSLPIGSSTGRLSSAKWLLPLNILRSAEELLHGVMELPGVSVAAILDRERRLLVAFKQRVTYPAQGLADRVSELFLAMDALLAGMGNATAPTVEDLLVTTTSEILMLRPLRNSPGFVLLTVFDRSVSILGLARTQLAKLAENFHPGPSSSSERS